jgi:tripartite-type tricarboxylate transporter receptor subunit TctC
VGKYLPGKPKLIVESKPGGRGGLGTAYMFKSVKPDGLTLGGLTIIVSQLATKKLPVDIRKFTHVGGIGGPAVVYVRKDTGITSSADLKSTSKKIIMGATGPNSPSVMQIRLFLNEIGQQNHQLIPGYKGQLGMLKAVRSDEVNMAFMVASLWMARRAGFEKEGIVRSIMESGITDKNGDVIGTKGLGVPTVDSQWRKFSPGSLNSNAYKAYTFLQGTRTLNFLYVLPPGTPAKFAKVWEQAMAKGLNDPEYLAMIDKLGAPHPVWTEGQTAKRVIDETVAKKNDPDIKAALQKVMVKR